MNEMNMIDKVAIDKAARVLFNYEQGERTMDDCLNAAKLVIKAMREPTEEMKIAGSIDPGSGGPDSGYETEVWQSMIDAALKE